jgi:hypothetical protein
MVLRRLIRESRIPPAPAQSIAPASSGRGKQGVMREVKWGAVETILCFEKVVVVQSVYHVETLID